MTGQTTQDGGSDATDPSRRICGRVSCEAELPDDRPNRIYCSDNCRKRAYEEREHRRQAEFVVQRLLTPERVAAALEEYHKLKREGEL